MSVHVYESMEIRPKDVKIPLLSGNVRRRAAARAMDEMEKYSLKADDASARILSVIRWRWPAKTWRGGRSAGQRH
jgi:hypothetical protein